MKNNCYESVLEPLLKRGAENARTVKQLTDFLEINRRALFALVQKERDNGVPILSNKETGGYYLPGDEKEFLGYIYRWSEQIKTQQFTRDALIESYEREYKRPCNYSIAG